MGIDLSRRKCGCVRSAISGWGHWWKYTRLRLALRKARSWVDFWRIKGQVMSRCWACRTVRDHIVPIAVGMGLESPPEGLEVIRRAEETEGRWKSWFKDRTFLGADSDHPDGVYAEKGGDMVCMTNDEYEHWYGRCSSSDRGKAGA